MDPSNIIRGDATAGALFSHDEQHRYGLWRRWNASAQTLLWIMLNPSTADEQQLDPTLRRCANFSRLWGYGGMGVANIYALRSTDPKGLWMHTDPIGPDNDEWIAVVCDQYPTIVVGWGASAMHDRTLSVARMLKRHARKVFCLGRTKRGEPRHPLYLRNNALLEHWGPDEYLNRALQELR